jgi:cell division protein FtsA
MPPRFVACIEFGTSRITVMVASRGVNNTINVKGVGECEYNGYDYEGFLDDDEVAAKVRTAIVRAEQDAGVQIERLFVGVPAAFSQAIVRDTIVNFEKRRKVLPSDIDRLFDEGAVFPDESGFILIDHAPVHFSTDDNRKIMQPQGLKTTKLSAKVCYMLAEKFFTDLVQTWVDGVSVARIRFLSTPLSEVLYLGAADEREGTMLLADVGQIMSSITIARGDGLVGMRTFPLGGGTVTEALMEGLHCSFAVAERLKTHIVLSLNLKATDTYSFDIRGQGYTFSAVSVNEIAEDVIGGIASVIKKHLAMFSADMVDHLPLYVTGGGLSHIRGAKSVLSRLVGRNVEVLAPWQPVWDKPELSAILGLVDTALEQQANEKAA